MPARKVKRSLPGRKARAGPDQTLETPGGVQISSKYLDREGTRNGFEPPPPERLRMFFSGPVGEGKSTFGCSISRAIIFDVENKTSGIQTWGAGTLGSYGKDAKHYEELAQDLISDKRAGKCPFDMVVIDPIDRFVQGVRSYLTGDTGGFFVESEQGKRSVADAVKRGMEGAGWAQVNDWVTNLLTQLYQAGFGWLALAHQHESVNRDSDGNAFRSWESTVTPRIRQFLYNESEFAGELSRVLAVQKVQAGIHPVTKKPRYRNRTVETFSLVLAPNEASLPTRVHIPILEDEQILQVPEGKGWKVFSEAYLRWVAALQKKGN